MKFQVIDCSPSLLRFDLEAYPDRDDSFIYDHLKYYCSKCASSAAPSLPSCQARVVGDSLVVVSRHKYARIAKDLAVPLVRVVVTDDASGDFAEFSERADVKVVDFKLIEQEEMQSAVQQTWHVFFFDSPLRKQNQGDFEAILAGFFLQFKRDRLMGRDPHVSQVAFPFKNTCGEFLATTPVGDESWVSNFWRACHKFSEGVATIVSYQGRRFGN